MKAKQKIIISRTDSIGDVVLTLPLAGMLKKTLPDCELYFLGRSYTRAVIQACEHINIFLDWDEISTDRDPVKRLSSVKADIIIHVFPHKEIAYLAKKAHILVRLGTTNRLYHWNTCNRLVRLSRKRSDLHEAQLNIKLIKSITGISEISTDDIPGLYGLSQLETLDISFSKLIDKDRFNLLLHPKSKGSAREWGLQNFKNLVEILPEENFNILISGTAQEGEILKDSGIMDDPRITDLTGKMSLSQLMSFIAACDGLVAASTGPLHLAAAMGIRAVGIYPPIRPMHPGRWAPLGPKATYLVQQKSCSDCRKQGVCHCMEEVTPESVKFLLVEND